MNPELIREIARQVLAAMAAAPAAPAAPAEIHPPMGICTGDYSKYAQLPIPATPAAPVAAALPVAAPVAAPVIKPATLLTGIVTESRLRAVKGPFRLSAEARLTPLATDWLRARNLRVDQGGELSESGRLTGAQILQSGSWAAWIEGSCPSVAKIREVMGPTLSWPSPASSLVGALKEVSRQVHRGQIGGGIFFVRSRLRAGCYANRLGNLQAVGAASPAEVAQGIEELAANVLLVEYAPLDFKTLLAMVQSFVTSPRPEVEGLIRDLTELTPRNG